MYTSNPTTLTSILDILQSLKGTGALERLLNSGSPSAQEEGSSGGGSGGSGGKREKKEKNTSENTNFVLDLVCLAQRRELVNLSSWLNQRLSPAGSNSDTNAELQFALTCVEFLSKKVQHVSSSAVGLPLDPSVCATFVQVLNSKRNSYGKHFASSMDALMNLLKNAPQFTSVNVGNANTATPSGNR